MEIRDLASSTEHQAQSSVLVHGSPPGGDDLTENDGAPEPTGWCIGDDEERADYAARRVVETRAQIARLKAQHAVRMANAQREAESAEAFFSPQLEQFAGARLPRGRKSLDLPSARLSFRTVRGGFRVSDERLAAEWARATLPEEVRDEVIARVADEIADRRRAIEDKALAAKAAELAETLFNTAICEVWATAPASMATETALSYAQAKATAAIPPGVVHVEDRESFTVNAPKGER